MPASPSPDASDDRPALAIIVVLYNSRATIAALWQCLVAQRMDHWRLIAVDNSPADGAGQFLQEHQDPRLLLIRNSRNEGFARAVNQGLRAALAQGVKRCLLLNPDVTCAPAFLDDLLGQWDATAAQVIVPRIMRASAPDCAWYAGGGFDRSWRFQNVHYPYDPLHSAPKLVEFASGCCLGIEAAVLHRIGLLDESFFVYWEDADFCLRLSEARVPIHYVPRVCLLHVAGASTGGERSPAAQRLFHQSYVVMMRKHFGFVAAVRAIWRTLAVEWRHRKREPGSWHHVATAMTSGLLRRRRPVPSLPRPTNT